MIYSPLLFELMNTFRDLIIENSLEVISIINVVNQCFPKFLRKYGLIYQTIYIFPKKEDDSIVQQFWDLEKKKSLEY